MFHIRRLTLFVFCLATLGMNNACMDQDSLGLLRRQLPGACFLEAREGDYYYFEFGNNKAVLVSRFGWNDHYLVGKIDHRSDSDNSPEIGKDYIVFRRSDRTMAFLSSSQYAQNADVELISLEPASGVWAKLPRGPARQG